MNLICDTVELHSPIGSTEISWGDEVTFHDFEFNVVYHDLFIEIHSQIVKFADAVECVQLIVNGHIVCEFSGADLFVYNSLYGQKHVMCGLLRIPFPRFRYIGKYLVYVAVRLRQLEQFAHEIYNDVLSRGLGVFPADIQGIIRRYVGEQKNIYQTCQVRLFSTVNYSTNLALDHHKYHFMPVLHNIYSGKCSGKLNIEINVKNPLLQICVAFADVDNFGIKKFVEQDFQMYLDGLSRQVYSDTKKALLFDKLQNGIVLGQSPIYTLTFANPGRIDSMAPNRYLPKNVIYGTKSLTLHISTNSLDLVLYVWGFNAEAFRIAGEKIDNCHLEEFMNLSKSFGRNMFCES